MTFSYKDETTEGSETSTPSTVTEVVPGTTVPIVNIDITPRHPAPLGWRCPDCNCIYSPLTAECAGCNLARHFARNFNFPKVEFK